MSIKPVRVFLSVALLGVGAIAAPMAAAAQDRPQAQHQGSQGHVEQRPGQNQSSQNHNASRPNQGQQQANRSGRYRITSTVNVRSGAGTNFRQVGQLRAGRTVQVDQVRNGWLHVNGQGWISAQFARRA